MHPFWIFLLGALVAVLIVQLSKMCFLPGGDQGVLKTMARQAARWSLAAEQDESLLVALLHANYGTGYLWAMTDIARPAQIEAATGLDFTKFRQKIVGIQDSVTRRMVRKYPEFAGENDLFLSRVAGKA